MGLTEDPKEARESGIDPTTGMQRKYVVLSEEERAQGFVRPVRLSYVHEKCGTVTTMAREIAETYARDPWFYGGTCGAGGQDPFRVGEAGEFVGQGTDERVATCPPPSPPTRPPTRRWGSGGRWRTSNPVSTRWTSLLTPVSR